MTKYVIASVRGNDFQVEADSPREAWAILSIQEQNTGRLWRTSCEYRNRYAVEMEGFTLFIPDQYSSGAYKEIV